MKRENETGVLQGDYCCCCCCRTLTCALESIPLLLVLRPPPTTTLTLRIGLLLLLLLRLPPPSHRATDSNPTNFLRLLGYTSHQSPPPCRVNLPCNDWHNSVSSNEPNSTLLNQRILRCPCRVCNISPSILPLLLLRVPRRRATKARRPNPRNRFSTCFAQLTIHPTRINILRMMIFNPRRHHLIPFRSKRKRKRKKQPMGTHRLLRA